MDHIRGSCDRRNIYESLFVQSREGLQAGHGNGVIAHGIHPLCRIQPGIRLGESGRLGSADGRRPWHGAGVMGTDHHFDFAEYLTDSFGTKR